MINVFVVVITSEWVVRWHGMNVTGAAKHARQSTHTWTYARHSLGPIKTQQHPIGQTKRQIHHNELMSRMLSAITAAEARTKTNYISCGALSQNERKTSRHPGGEFLKTFSCTTCNNAGLQRIAVTYFKRAPIALFIKVAQRLIITYGFFLQMFKLYCRFRQTPDSKGVLIPVRVDQSATVQQLIDAVRDKIRNKSLAVELPEVLF